jgi:hypothetical protein
MPPRSMSLVMPASLALPSILKLLVSDQASQAFLSFCGALSLHTQVAAIEDRESVE